MYALGLLVEGLFELDSKEFLASNTIAIWLDPLI